MPLQQSGQKVFMDGYLSPFQGSDFFGVGVNRDDLVPDFSQTNGGHEAHITRANDGNAHDLLQARWNNCIRIHTPRAAKRTVCSRMATSMNRLRFRM